MAKFDIQVTITVEAVTEELAEMKIENVLNDFHQEFEDWNFTEFVPCDDLRNSCCC